MRSQRAWPLPQREMAPRRWRGPLECFDADQAQIGHELAGMSEAMDVAQFADGDHGGDELEAAKGHEGLDGGLEAPGFQQG